MRPIAFLLIVMVDLPGWRAAATNDDESIYDALSELQTQLYCEG